MDQEGDAAQEPTKVKRKIKEKKQIIDNVTELADGPGAKVGRGRDGGLGAPMVKDVSEILTEQHFLPRSTIVMRLLEIRDDPLAHFLPTKVTPAGTFVCAAPPGLAPELAELFMRPVNGFPSKKRGASPHKTSNKRPRLDGSVAGDVPGDDEIGQARRAASLAPSVGLGSDIMGRRSIVPDGGIDFADQTAGFDDFQLDIPEFEMGAGDVDVDVGVGDRLKSAAPTDLSRLSTPGPDVMQFDEGDETYADAACPIAMFDVQPATQTQTQSTEQEPEAENEGKGYSKNTVKALGIIRKNLRPVAGEEDADKVLSFKKMSEKVCSFS